MMWLVACKERFALRAELFPCACVDNSWLAEKKSTALGLSLFLDASCAPSLQEKEGKKRKRGVKGSVGRRERTREQEEGKGRRNEQAEVRTGKEQLTHIL